MAILEVSSGIPPYTVDWGGDDPTDLTAGNYMVTVTDSENQSVAVSFSIPDGLAVCGCVYDTAVNYDVLAQVDDGSCEFDNSPLNGCEQLDFNGNGEIDTPDLLTILGAYGSTCE